MANALIFLPNFDGHRQVHAFVLSHILSELGYTIYIAGDFSSSYNNSFYLDKLKNENKIFKIDTNKITEHGLDISNAEFVDLQKKNNIDLTIIAEADNHISLLISQILPGKSRFYGKTIGVFLRPWHFYERLNSIDTLRYIKRLSSKWKSDKRVFHELFNSAFKLLDTSIYLDEYFVSKHKKCIWIPDVWQQYADKLISEQTSDQRIWIEKLDEFRNNNKGRFLILYFGTSQVRRGYDVLLKLAIDQDACFVHCGLRNDKDNYKYNVDEYRGLLAKDNRLFETNQYITDPYCIEYFFKSATHLILPYRNFLGSSGVMLQALGYGIPVLVSDIGLIGYQVKKYNLGHTFSTDSLEKEFIQFITKSPSTFSNSITEFMKLQSVDQLQAILNDIFTKTI